MVVDTYRYNAYGKLLNSTGSDANPFRYGGKFGYYTDANTGLQLAGARWYSPNAFRWLGRDPIHYRGGDNLYSYVSGNPVKYVDPSGLDAAGTAYTGVGSFLGGVAGGALAASSVVASGGALLPLAPEIVAAGVAGGAVVGGIVGGGIGNIACEQSLPIILHSKGERRYGKGRGSDPYFGKTVDELKRIVRDATGQFTAAEKARAATIAKILGKKRDPQSGKKNSKSDRLKGWTRAVRQASSIFIAKLRPLRIRHRFALRARQSIISINEPSSAPSMSSAPGIANQYG